MTSPTKHKKVPSSTEQQIAQLSELVKNVQKEIDKLVDQKDRVESALAALKRQSSETSLKDSKEHSEKRIKKKSQLQEEIRTLKKEKEELSRKVVEFEDTVSLNVGGTIYYTSRSTLQKVNTMLSSMFSGRHKLTKDNDGHYFVDRDGTLFRYILNYLRNGYLPDLPRKELFELRGEAEYFSILPLVRDIDEKLRDSTCAKFAVLRYNENSASNNLSWQGLTEPCPLTTGKNLFKCIDEVLTECDYRGWELLQMSGDGSADSGWMYVFRKKPRLPFALVLDDRATDQRKLAYSSARSTPGIPLLDFRPTLNRNHSGSF